MLRATLMVLVGSISLAACGPSSGRPTEPAAVDPSSNPRPAGSGTTTAKEDFVLPSVTTPGNVTLETGKITLLVFWATWHGPSKKAFPRFAELQSRFASRGFTIVALSVDDEPSLVGQAAREWGANFPVAWDKDHEVALAWRPPLMPTIYLLDRHRAVVHQHGGYREGDADALASEIEALLAR